MFAHPDGHGLYFHDEHKNFICMATKRSSFEREGGDMSGMTPIGFMPYRPFGGSGEISSSTIGIVTRNARELVAKANKIQPTQDGLAKMIKARNEDIKRQLGKAARHRAKAGSENGRRSVRPSRRMRAAV